MLCSMGQAQGNRVNWRALTVFKEAPCPETSFLVCEVDGTGLDWFDVVCQQHPSICPNCLPRPGAQPPTNLDANPYVHDSPIVLVVVTDPQTVCQVAHVHVALFPPRFFTPLPRQRRSPAGLAGHRRWGGLQSLGAHGTEKRFGVVVKLE